MRKVLEDQAERKERREAASAGQGTKLLPLPVVALLWGLACLVVWAATPSFLLPEPVPSPDPDRAEAGLRMQMLALVSEVEDYRDAVGRVPRVLSEVPAEAPGGVEYVRLSPSTYRLVGERGDVEIVFQSGTPAGEFMGDARDRIERARSGDR